MTKPNFSGRARNFARADLTHHEKRPRTGEQLANNWRATGELLANYNEHHVGGHSRTPENARTLSEILVGTRQCSDRECLKSIEKTGQCSETLIVNGRWSETVARAATTLREKREQLASNWRATGEQLANHWQSITNCIPPSISESLRTFPGVGEWSPICCFVIAGNSS